MLESGSGAIEGSGGGAAIGTVGAAAACCGAGPRRGNGILPGILPVTCGSGIRPTTPGLAPIPVRGGAAVREGVLAVGAAWLVSVGFGRVVGFASYSSANSSVKPSMNVNTGFPVPGPPSSHDTSLPPRPLPSCPPCPRFLLPPPPPTTPAFLNASAGAPARSKPATQDDSSVVKEAQTTPPG